jgi:hypothetical protein
MRSRYQEQASSSPEGKAVAPAAALDRPFDEGLKFQEFPFVSRVVVGFLGGIAKLTHYLIGLRFGKLRANSLSWVASIVVE